MSTCTYSGVKSSYHKKILFCDIASVHCSWEAGKYTFLRLKLDSKICKV